MRIWRISSYADLSGEGGRLAAARWNPVDSPVVYCADHPASALLEMVVHIDPEDFPQTYQLVEIDVPEGLDVYEPDLPGDWSHHLALTQRIGSRFISSASAPIMAVPSVIVPFAKNYLLNPALVEALKIRIVGVTRHPVDPRLIG